MGLSTIKRSADFQRVRGGLRVATPLFVIEARMRATEPNGVGGSEPRVGLTITKKIGGAVVRNRIRRRLKSILLSHVSARLRDGHDYVVVARNQIVEHPFCAIEAAVAQALERLHAQKIPGIGHPQPGNKPGSARISGGQTPLRDTASRTIRPKTPL